MSPEWTLERTLARYADQIYCLALLYDRHPARAARATATAFQTLDWSTAQADDQLEGRLIAALPRPRRRLRHMAIQPLAADFWHLPAITRVALALRLTRGYSSEAIAAMLGQTPDTIRQTTLDALSGGGQGTIPEACHRSRLLRLDDAGTERGHSLRCEACRAWAVRVAEAETTLAGAIERATAKLRLPRGTVEAILSSRIRSTVPTPHIWCRPATLSAVLAAIVVMIIAALVAPRSIAQRQTQASTTARDFLAAAMTRYGAAPSGEGVVHERFEIILRQPAVTLQAETWTDATNPGRHRMQVTTDNVIQEWQVGDGSGTLRYLSNGTLQSCGRNYPGAVTPTSVISRWSMDVDEQATMRAARWRFGAWALGQRYLEQAQAADTLRSLGVVVENDNPVVTLAAEDATISGTLLLKLDANDATLREVRDVVVDNGATRATVLWRLLNTERLDLPDVTRAGLLSSFPAQPRPRESERPTPILDPACPLWDADHAYSLMNTLRRGTTPIVGLSQAPQGIDRIYLAGRRRAGGEAYGEADHLRLVYVGAGKRLTLVALPGLEGPVTTGTIPQEAISTGEWLVQIRSASIVGIRGEARPAPQELRSDSPSIWFIAEGWTEAEVIHMLADARLLNLKDLRTQRALIYEPGPVAAGSRESRQ